VPAAPANAFSSSSSSSSAKMPKEERLLPDFSDPSYYEIKKNGMSPFQNMLA